jgi:hypothetical protein
MRRKAASRDALPLSVSPFALPYIVPSPILPVMFVVTEADAAAIRAVYEQDGELSAAIELRRRFPGIADNENARACVRSIAGWTPLPAPAPKVTRRSGKQRPRL